MKAVLAVLRFNKIVGGGGRKVEKLVGSRLKGGSELEVEHSASRVPIQFFSLLYCCTVFGCFESERTGSRVLCIVVLLEVQ